jgi:hypothetical protein
VIRKAIRISLFVSAIACFSIGALFLASNSGVESTIESSREIAATFGSAHAFVEGWRSDTGNLPTEAQFQQWASGQSERVYGPHGLSYSTKTYPAEVAGHYGPAPPDAYLLSVWRGEWFEYDPSWSSDSSLIFDKSRYFFLRSATADAAAAAGLGASLLLMARALKPGAV